MNDRKKANLRRVSDVEPQPEVTTSPTDLGAVVRKTVVEILPSEWHVLPDGRAKHSVIASEVLKRLD